jgi:hypothetical protein
MPEIATFGKRFYFYKTWEKAKEQWAIHGRGE